MQYLPWAIKPTLVLGSQCIIHIRIEKIKLQRVIEYEISV
jgi:hypothetical protein